MSNSLLKEIQTLKPDEQGFQPQDEPSAEEFAVIEHYKGNFKYKIIGGVIIAILVGLGIVSLIFN